MIFFAGLREGAAACFFFVGVEAAEVDADGFDAGDFGADGGGAAGLESEVCAAAGDDPAEHMRANISAKRKKLRRTTTTLSYRLIIYRLIIAENCCPGEKRRLPRDCESVPD
jgi:hypothetical protein